MGTEEVSMITPKRLYNSDPETKFDEFSFTAMNASLIRINLVTGQKDGKGRVPTLS